MEYGDDRDFEGTPESQNIDNGKIEEEGELEPEQISEAIHHGYANDDDPNGPNHTEHRIQDFQAKQKVLKECFNDLLTNILHVINEDIGIIAKSGENINRIYEIANTDAKEIDSDLETSPEIFSETFSCVETLYQNHQTLKEMTEFLSVHLMKFFSEVDSYREHVLENVPHSEQILDLVHENDFLYHKLNESNKKIEQLFFRLQQYEKEYPEIARKLSTNLRRANSVPNLSFASDTDQPQDSQDLQERIRKFMHKLSERMEDQFGTIAIEDQSPGYWENRQITSTQYNDRDFVGNDPEADQENNFEKKVDILESYNIFLLKFIKKIKLLIDDNSTPVKIRMGQLAEISKELDDM